MVFTGGEGVTALDAESGSQVWYQNLNTTQTQRTPIVASNGSVFVAINEELFAVDASTGEIEWRKPSSTTPPAVTDEVVYTTTRDYGLAALNPEDGSQKWSVTAPTNLGSKPVVGKNTVYVNGKQVYVFDQETGERINAMPSDSENIPTIVGRSVLVSTGNGRLLPWVPSE